MLENFRSFLCICLVLSSSAASAFSCGNLSPKEIYSTAQHVFKAQVTKAWIAGGSDDSPLVVEAEFEIYEVYKGSPTDHAVIRSVSPGHAGTTLIPGQTYLFVLGENNEVNSCTSKIYHFYSDVFTAYEDLRDGP